MQEEDEEEECGAEERGVGKRRHAGSRPGKGDLLEVKWVYKTNSVY